MTKSPDWFVDLFPAIVSVTCAPLLDLVPKDSVPHDSLVRGLRSDGKEGLTLLSLCEKYCLVNGCEYASHMGFLLEPVLDLMSVESGRMPNLLSAIFHFREKFVAVVPTGFVLGGSKYLDSLRLMEGLIKFHRPGQAALLSRDLLSGWLQTGLVSACDSRETARELMASVAASGEPAMVPFLIVAAPDLMTLTNTSDWRVTGENLIDLWATATEVAWATPKNFSSEFALIATPSGRRTPTVPPIPNYRVLSTPADAVVQDLVSKLDTADPEQSVDVSEVHSISDEESFGGILVECAAGAHVASLLSVFSIVRSASPNADTEKLKTTIYIDARSERDRAEADHVVIQVGVRQVSKDWYDEGGKDSSEGLGPCVLVRLKQCLWVDDQVEFTNATIADPTHAACMFFKKLEFFRGARLCLIESARASFSTSAIFSHSQTSFLQLLLLREFPYVCVVRGGFAALRDALVSVAGANLEDLAITSPPPDIQPVLKVADQLNLMGSKFLASWRSKPTEEKAQAPTKAKTPPPMIDFEIGSSDDEHQMSSVDLSP